MSRIQELEQELADWQAEYQLIIDYLNLLDRCTGSLIDKLIHENEMRAERIIGYIQDTEFKLRMAKIKV